MAAQLILGGHFVFPAIDHFSKMDALPMWSI
jgi:hypothetical protein